MIEDFKPDIVNNLKNPALESAIRAVYFSPSKTNISGFFRVLIESTMVVLTLSAPKNDDGINYSDESGFSRFDIGTKIELVQLKDENEELILPIFTEAKHVHRVAGLENFHGMAISALNILEMAIAAKSAKVVFNLGSVEQLELDRPHMMEIVKQFRNFNLLPNDPIMKNESSSTQL